MYLGAMTIRALQPEEEWRGWLGLRELLWKDTPEQVLLGEMEGILANPARNAVFIAESPLNSAGFPFHLLAGFAEVTLRDSVEGCATRPVGYVEAWYVAPASRRKGLGRQLLEAAEQWVLSRGYTEIASDPGLKNEVNVLAYRALGYSEGTRPMLFRKKLID